MGSGDARHRLSGLRGQRGRGGYLVRRGEMQGLVGELGAGGRGVEELRCA